MSGFNPNAGSFNPNAGSFNPGGAPPFQPGRQYNPYAQQQQQPGAQPQGGANPADYYNQYNAGGYGGGYGEALSARNSFPEADSLGSVFAGGYGGYPQQGGYPAQQQQVPQGYGANDPFAQQYNQNPYNAPRQPQPTRNPAPAAAPSASSPFTRTLPDSNAPPAKAVSLSIGGKSVSLPSSTAPKTDKPASVSLSIGGGASKASSSSKNTTPASSKPATPGPGSASVAAAGTSTAPAKKADAQLNAAEKKIEQMDKKQEKAEQKVKKDEAKRQEKVEKEEKDADKIEEEVKASVDEDTLVDLYGDDSMYILKSCSHAAGLS